MVFYDFVEIGTSNFETEIQVAQARETGLAIDPLQIYLDQLPDKPRCTKFCAAVSDHNGQIDVYSVSPQNISRHQLPKFTAGWNSVNQPHPTMVKFLQDRHLDPHQLIEKTTVPAIDFSTLVEKFDIDGIHFLKVDTEGHDHVILSHYCDLVTAKPWLRAHKIKFESNRLTSRDDVTQTIQRLTKLGYTLISSGLDTVMHLKFDQIQVPRTGPFEGYYLQGHPDGYDPQNKPHDQDLQSAMDYAQQIGAGGVTLQKGIYSVRKASKFIQYRQGSSTTWFNIKAIQGVHEI